MGCSPPSDSPSESLATPSRESPADPALIVHQTPRAPKKTDWFLDVTAKSGIDFLHRSGRDAGRFAMPEGFGAGVAVLDYDSDGDLDLFCLGGGTISADGKFSGASCSLFKNNGDFRFTDVTNQVGLNLPIDYSHGVAIGDIDNDGDPDLFISTYGQSRLFRNDQGERFVDITQESGLDLSGWHTACAFGDVNSDGAIDLYVAGYLEWTIEVNHDCVDPDSGRRDVCMPGDFTDAQDQLWLNLGNGKFRDATEEAGLLPGGKGLGVVIEDFNLDGALDIYVANDVVRNYFYQGRGDGTFEETAVLAGLVGNEFGAPEGSMGVDAVDVDGDGLSELFVTNYENEDNSLYHNQGKGLFSHQTVSYGLSGAVRPYVGFGTLFLDANLDNLPDLIVGNGHITYHNRKSDFQQPTFLYENQDGRRFVDVTEKCGAWFSVPHVVRGMARADFDNDGAMDLVISEWEGPVSLLKNQNETKTWIGIALRGTDSGRDAIGSRVRINSPQSALSRTVRSGGSYLSSSDPRVLFSSLTTQLESVEVLVEWPNGTKELFSELPPNQYHQLVEGRGTLATNANGR